ncbi:MAG: hypothetical protein EOL88_10400 [Bacteroidia bacterium]|nr:hypothetical protein [Bacteroidia bacterium]
MQILFLFTTKERKDSCNAVLLRSMRSFASIFHKIQHFPPSNSFKNTTFTLFSCLFMFLVAIFHQNSLFLVEYWIFNAFFALFELLRGHFPSKTSIFIPFSPFLFFIRRTQANLRNLRNLRIKKAACFAKASQPKQPEPDSSQDSSADCADFSKQILFLFTTKERKERKDSCNAVLLRSMSSFAVNFIL